MKQSNFRFKSIVKDEGFMPVQQIDNDLDLDIKAGFMNSYSRNRFVELEKLRKAQMTIQSKI